jgi:hypothetical protein
LLEEIPSIQTQLQLKLKVEETSRELDREVSQVT